MLPAGCLHGLLAQEVLALGELRIELVIEVIAVCNDNDGRFIEDGLNQMSIEHHRQGFSTSLCMPEYTNLAIGVGGPDSAIDSFFYGKVLMISGQNLSGACLIHAKAGEVLNEIEETVALEHSHEECVVVHEILCLLKAILRFPFHEAVFLAGNGTGLGERHVTHYAEYVVDEQ